jgi:uncharacterized pyridoxamine 5'-phosphate oxidase family protein
MNFGQIKRFTKQLGWGYLATTDGKKAAVRPMGGLAWRDNELLCATFESSDKVAQIRKIPHAEYCFCDSTGRHVRISGHCTISTDSAEKLWLYEAVPVLKEHISDPASSDYVVIKMTPDSIRFTDATDMTYSQVEF